MPRAGMVGALPWPAWAAVAGMLSSPEDPEKDWQSWHATVLSLRRTCKALAELVGAGCAGGAGRLDVDTAEDAAQLEAAATAGLGRALLVTVRLPDGDPSHPTDVEEQALAPALAVAVERGHMIGFEASFGKECPSAAAWMIQAALIEASRKGLLSDAHFCTGESSGWSVDAMAQLSVVGLSNPERETVATLVDAGTLQRISLAWVESSEWADVSILSSLREVMLVCCAVEDLSPLADVARLVVAHCGRIKALLAMRNNVLEVRSCSSLTDVSGLAGGRVGCLELWHLDSVEDVSAIGAMRPPPRTVILEEMYEVQDVSMLAGIRRLELIGCRKLDKAATLAALKGKVGTIQWLEED